MNSRDSGFGIRDSLRCAVAFLLLCAAFGVQAEDVTATIQSRIAQSPVLRGEFAQTKAIVGFRSPLRSSGTFVVDRERGVIWDTEQPFASTLVLGRERIRTGSGGVLEDIRIEGDAEQAVKELNAMLIAVLAGRLDALRQRFDADGTLVDAARWTLTLTPRDAQVSRAVQSIELRGARHVEYVVLLDPAGNRTEIAFTGQRSEPPVLDDAEAARFD